MPTHIEGENPESRGGSSLVKRMGWTGVAETGRMRGKERKRRVMAFMIS